MAKNIEETLRNIKMPESGSITWSMPIISGDKIVFGACDKYFYCLDKNTGKLIWKFLTGGPITHPAAVVKDKVFFSSHDNHHYCLSLKTGDALWKRLFPQWPAAPTFIDGTLYLGCTDNNFYALAAEDGRHLWSFRSGGLIAGVNAVINDSVYFGSFDKNLYCLDMEGKLRWKFLTGGCISSPLGASVNGQLAWDYSSRNENVKTGENGSVLFGSFDNYFYSLSLDGQLRWKFLTGNIVASPPAIHDGYIYFGSWDRNFYSLDAENGSMKWRFVTGGPIDTHAFVSDNVAYFGSGDRNFYALGLDGRRAWAFTTGGIVLCSPLVKEGVVYFGSVDSFLYAIRLSDKKLLWKFQTGMPAGSYEQFFKDWTGVVETEKKQTFGFTQWKPETLKKSYDWKTEVGNIITSPYRSENPYMNKTTYRMDGSYETQQKKKKEPWER